jgi:small subunit ribosomal protein S2
MPKYKVPTIEELIEAGVHFGHHIRRWHHKMEKYIYMVNKNVHIIDLEQTEILLKKACEYLYEVAKTGKPIIFVGTKRQSKEIIEAEAKRCGAMYVSHRWIGGAMTNFKMIKANLDKLTGFIKGREEVQ